MSFQRIIDEYLNTPIFKGGRNHELFKAAAACKDEGYSQTQAEQALLNKAQGDGLPYGEIMQTIRSAFDRPISDAPRLEHNTIGANLDWDDDLGGMLHAPKRKIEVYKAEIPPPSSTWEHDLKTLLSSGFEENEKVCIVKDLMERDGKHVPASKGTTMSVGQLLEAPTEKLHDWIDHNNGAFMRINPMDGEGVKDANVTAYRHVLVESDTLPMQEQLAIYRELQLPVSGLIHSGGKSIHAWVRVEAENIDQYKKRCAYIYDILEAQGFEIDHSNKNPSRLSRLVGVMRGTQQQYLISDRSGQPDFETWVKWWETKANGLPEIESFDSIITENPELDPILIDGMLRQGHKMLIGGPSKAGKTFWLINLALSLQSGKPFFGFSVKQSNVLIVNFEIARASFYDRVKKVAEKLGVNTFENLDVWNLRGKSAGIEELAPQIIRKIKDRNYGAVILDPAYKMMGQRDENNAGDITSMMNYLDQIAVQTGCSIIIAAHFSKGKQGEKSPTDRISGSGVFGRDPDAIITMSEIKDESNAYLLEGTLREFAAFDPIGIRFDWPIHVIDDSLKDAQVDGDLKKKINDQEIYDSFLTLSGGDMNQSLFWKDFKKSLDIPEQKLKKHIMNMKPYEGLQISINGGMVVLREVH